MYMYMYMHILCVHTAPIHCAFNTRVYSINNILFVVGLYIITRHLRIGGLFLRLMMGGGPSIVGGASGGGAAHGPFIRRISTVRK